jgi:hypothetical protein
MVPTMKVMAEGFDEPIIINKDDFNPDIHTLLETEPQPGPELTAESLMKQRKDVLVSIAVEKGLEIVPDELTKADIVDRILESEKS